MLGPKVALFTTILLVCLVYVQGLIWMLLIALNVMLFLSVAGIVIVGLTHILWKREVREQRDSCRSPSTRKPFTKALHEYLELLEH